MIWCRTTIRIIIGVDTIPAIPISKRYVKISRDWSIYTERVTHASWLMEELKLWLLEICCDSQMNCWRSCSITMELLAHQNTIFRTCSKIVWTLKLKNSFMLLLSSRGYLCNNAICINEEIVVIWILSWIRFMWVWFTMECLKWKGCSLGCLRVSSMMCKIFRIKLCFAMWRPINAVWCCKFFC